MLFVQANEITIVNLSGLELYYFILKVCRIPLTIALTAEVFGAHAKLFAAI